MYLREIAVSADESIVMDFPSGFVSWFHRETCCVTELYEALIYRKIRTLDTAKVNLVYFNDEGLVPTVRQLLNVADATWSFDFVTYTAADDHEKKRMILEATHAALLWIANKRQWDTEPLALANAQILDRNLAFESLAKKTWFSPNRRYKAKVGFTYSLRSIQFFVAVYDKKGNELGRKTLGSVAPGRGIVHSILKQRAEWDPSNVLRLQIGDICFHFPKQWEVDLSDVVT